MSHALIMMVQSPSCFAAVRAAKKRSPPPPPRKKTQRQSPATTTTSHGFGGEKKTPVWQCVENCGACCKLDKGPTFPSAEEIFDDPSDVEVCFRCLLPHCVLCACVCRCKGIILISGDRWIEFWLYFVELKIMKICEGMCMNEVELSWAFQFFCKIHKLVF